MNRTFTYTLKKEEYLSFLRFQSANSKHAGGIRMWLRISLPALLLCVSIILHLFDQLLWTVFACILVIAWEWRIVPFLWKKYLYKTINEETIRHMNITSFQKVTVSFHHDKIVYKDKKAHDILYSNILMMIPANDMYIFQYKEKGTLLLPYRLFDGKEDVIQFFKEFEDVWKAYRS